MTSVHLLSGLERRIALDSALSPLSATRAVLNPDVALLTAMVDTLVLRNGVAFGHLFTARVDAAPTSGGAVLGGGTLWFEAPLLGAALAMTPGWVGVPFASATLATTGKVTFSNGRIALDPDATLRLTLTSAMNPATTAPGATPGRDFLAAKLVPFPGATVHFASGAASISLDGEGAATIFGQHLTFSPAAVARPTVIDLPTPGVRVPCSAAAPDGVFQADHSFSKEIELSGRGRVTGGAVWFPIVPDTPDARSAAVDGWGLIVETGAGIEARFGGLIRPTPVAAGTLAVLPTRLAGRLRTSAARVVDRYDLWQPAPQPARPTRMSAPAPPPLALPPASVELEMPGGSELAFVLSPAADAVILLGVVDAVLDRPVAADGRRVPFKGPGVLSRVRDATGTSIEVASRPGLDWRALALVAENALIPVDAPLGLVIRGRLERGRIDGVAEILFPAPAILPTLPDPYAAVYAVKGVLHPLGLLVTMTPTAGGPPVVGFRVPATPALAAEGHTTSSFALLDVSTNADLWGVGHTGHGDGGLDFDGLSLTAPNAGSVVFTVPGISWEPIVDGDKQPTPAWLAALSPDDGVPTTFLVPSTKRTPIVPSDALQQYADAAGPGTKATFTLPFGIVAQLDDNRGAGSGIDPPHYSTLDVAFPEANMTAALILSIESTGRGTDAGLPGSAQIGVAQNAAPYGAQVMGSELAGFWNQQFKAVIPVGRIDLGGYGSSMFSDWHNPDPTAIGVTRGLFNVLLGRTAHEVVQAQTWILPWSIRVRRTVTFDRSDGGAVVKHDTGWLAVGGGVFELLDADTKLDGPVKGLVGVRNVVFDDGGSIIMETTAGTKEKFARVTFDADVRFSEPLHIWADGRDHAPSAVGHAIVGYASSTVGAAPAAQDVINLMSQIGMQVGTTRLTGTTACVASVGAAAADGFALNVTSFGAALASGSPPKLQVALFGTPRLPKGSQWSVTRRGPGDGLPQPVDSRTPVPLTRGIPGTAGESVSSALQPPHRSYGENWRLLDPEDAQSVDSPSTFYGLLQGTGTSKTLLEHPLISDDGGALDFDHKPQLADVGALLGAGGLFPDLGQALEIDNPGEVLLGADGFTRTYRWPINDPERQLLAVSIVRLMLVYAGSQGTASQGTLKLTPDEPNWSLLLENLSFEARVGPLGTLLTVSGDYQADAQSKPRFTLRKVDFGPALGAVTSVLTKLSELAGALGGKADLEVGFTGQQLSVRQGFTLPKIPLGFGEITDVGMDLGFSATIPSDAAFHVGIGSREDPFHWLVDPLAGTGAIVLGIAHGDHDLYLEAGIGVGLGISVAVASGSASIVVSASVAVTDSTVTLGLMLTGNAEVDVLGGVASASLTLSAGISVTLESGGHKADLTGEVAVGIHISICWVIDISFDGHWDFTETIEL